MVKCYSCKVPLTVTNKSEEHIIKQSFGSPLKSSNLLCKQCNSDFGNTLDSDFSKELDHITDALGINTRNIKKVKMFTEEAKVEIRGSGMQALSYVKFEVDGEEIIIPNIPEDQLEKIALQKIKELEKSGKGKFEFKNVPLPQKKETKYFHKEKGVVFGSETFYLSFVKIAIGFFLYKKGEMKYVNHAIDVIKKKVTDFKIAKFYYSQLNKVDTERDEVSHFIYLRGDKERKLLYCYVDLFCTHKMLVFLSDQYEGEDIEEQFGYDIINKKEVTRKFSMNLSRSHYEDYQNLPSNSEVEHDRLYKRLLRIIQDKYDSQNP